MTRAPSSIPGSRIRPAVAEDFERVFPLLEQLMPHKKLCKDDSRSVFMKSLELDYQRSLVTVTDDMVIAYAMIMVKNNYWMEGDIACLDALVVHEDFRNKGVGAELLDEAVKLSRALGCRGLELETGFHREDAHRFYIARGLEKMGYIFAKIF